MNRRRGTATPIKVSPSSPVLQPKALFLSAARLLLVVHILNNVSAHQLPGETLSSVYSALTIFINFAALTVEHGNIEI
jgi:hypothetical protein